MKLFFGKQYLEHSRSCKVFVYICEVFLESTFLDSHFTGWSWRKKTSFFTGSHNKKTFQIIRTFSLERTTTRLIKYNFLLKIFWQVKFTSLLHSVTLTLLTFEIRCYLEELKNFQEIEHLIGRKESHGWLETVYIANQKNRHVKFFSKRSRQNLLISWSTKIS